MVILKNIFQKYTQVKTPVGWDTDLITMQTKFSLDSTIIIHNSLNICRAQMFNDTAYYYFSKQGCISEERDQKKKSPYSHDSVKNY